MIELINEKLFHEGLDACNCSVSSATMACLKGYSQELAEPLNTSHFSKTH